MKIIRNLAVGVAALVVLLALLSLTLLNRQSSFMRMTALMREGRLAMEDGDYSEAIDAYRLAIWLNERSVRAYLALAEACEANGEMEDAKYFLQLGLKKTNNTKIRDAHEALLKKMGSETPAPEPPEPEIPEDEDPEPVPTEPVPTEPEPPDDEEGDENGGDVNGGDVNGGEEPSVTGEEEEDTETPAGEEL